MLPGNDADSNICDESGAGHRDCTGRLAVVISPEMNHSPSGTVIIGTQGGRERTGSQLLDTALFETRSKGSSSARSCSSSGVQVQMSIRGNKGHGGVYTSPSYDCAGMTTRLRHIWYLQDSGDSLTL